MNIKDDFPQLMTGIKYFDNAATSLKPFSVIKDVTNYYYRLNANPHGGIHKLSAEASELISKTRQRVADYLGVQQKEIIFTHGATEGLNIIAHGLISRLSPDDEIICTRLEHHSNLLPWNQNWKNCRILECSLDGILYDIDQLINEHTKILTITAASNVLGNISNLYETIEKAKRAGLIVVVDAAQAIAHQKIDMTNVDFLAFSGHKIYGPMGVGILYGKRELLENLPPLLFGGGMISSVEDNKLDLAELPHRLEAGTPNAEGIIALEKAFDYLTEENFEREQELGKILHAKMREIPNVKVYSQVGPLMSFNVEGVHPHDVAAILDSEKFAIRAGYHCAQPLLDKLEIGPCCRASLAFYNSEEEIDDFVEVIKTVRQRMGL